MAAVIRKTTLADAPKWLDLLKAALGEDYPDKQAYDPAWIASQLDPNSDVETWVAEEGGKLLSSISFLPPIKEQNVAVGNLGRHLNRPESYTSGGADALLKKVVELAGERKQLLVARVFASDNRLQIAYENCGFHCVGFQPFKHMHRVRESVLFYVRMSRQDMLNRLPISESLPQISELGAFVLNKLKLSNAVSIRDGVTGYPLQTELKFHEGTMDDYELWRMQAQSANPPVEISGLYNQGIGYMRIMGPANTKVILAEREGKMIAGLAFVFDGQDRCLRLVDSFSQDDLSTGALVNHAVKLAQGQEYNAIYLEADILLTAPRLLKSLEQLGFVPIAYLPAFYSKGSATADVVKMIKLNMVYSQENVNPTAEARSIIDIIDHNFQDQKIGVAIINLLRALPFFEGLGDGELRKIARLFTQKLFRPNEKIFSKGDSGNEAYVVMRGQIDIMIDDHTKIASLGNGQIFGELAFLDGTPRTAMAMASQASILLVIQRSAFNDLVHHEPHLGMVVMRNIALELSNRLRRANTALSARK